MVNKETQLLNRPEQLLRNLQMRFKDMTQEEIPTSENQLITLVEQANQRLQILVQ